MELPKEINFALNLLEQNGFEAFVVGGCVRDFLLEETQKDFDITTNATPTQMMEVFAHYKVIATGLKHGSVTIIINSLQFDITTYRIDCDYSDNRRPDTVMFTKSLKEDLARRDFTMNAVCYNPHKGFVDYFGGINDIKSKIIKTVNEPEKRFSEDSLRILRALRFASVYAFKIDEGTSNGIFASKELLKNISSERITAELIKTLCGKNMKAVISEYYSIYGVVIPEIMPMAGFNQMTKYHIHDILTHSIITVENVSSKPHMKLAALLHDIGKPTTFSIDKAGVGHFYGHVQESVQMSEKILTRLKLDNITKNKILTLVKYHDTRINSDEQTVKTWLNKLGPNTFFDLLELKRADSLAQNPEYFSRIEDINKLKLLSQKIIKEKQCFSLMDLCIDGNDLIKLGFKKGKEIGLLLNQILEEVILNQIENKKEILENYAVSLLQKTNHHS